MEKVSIFLGLKYWTEAILTVRLEKLSGGKHEHTCTSGCFFQPFLNHSQIF